MNDAGLRQPEHRSPQAAQPQAEMANLDVSNLQSGTYVLQATVNGAVSTQKFVKK
jgi:hypothetical protein